jgi:hypothetical protein
MPRGAKGRKGQGVPHRASCGWSQTCGFWGNGICAEKFVIGYEDGTSDANIYVTSPTISGYAGSSGCTNPVGTWPYAEHYNINHGGIWTSHYLKMDMWRLLAESQWSSSVVLYLYPKLAGSSRSTTGDIRVYPEAASSPALASVARSFTDGSCNGPSYSTLTIYDDGTYTLA